MDFEITRPGNTDIQTRQKQAKPLSLPLGTADWHRFPNGSTPTFKKGDIFVGKTLDGHPVGANSAGHIGVIAATRSGKGTSLIIPNLITWPGSIVVIDPKGENAILTARRRGSGSRYARGMGQRVFILDPFNDVQSGADNFDDLRATFNPLDMLSINDSKSVSLAGRIADAIVVAEGSDDNRFWNESARSLIKGVILHVASSADFEAKNRNLLTVADLILEGYAELRALLLANSEDNKAPSAFALLFRAMSKNKAFAGEVAKAGNRYGRMEASGPRMLESFASVACSNLDFLAEDEMKQLVRTSSFSLSDLKNDPRGISVYLCLPERYMETHFRFLRMMISLINGEMSRMKNQPESGHPILMVLDEFASLKRMTSIENAFAQIAGSGVRMMMIVQNIAQLKYQYKENWSTLLENCTTKVCFGNEGETAEYISKLCGDVETIRQTSSYNQSRGSSSSESHGETQGNSENNTNGRNAGWSSGQSGWSVSGSASSSQTQGSSHSQSETNTFGHNQSATTGVSEALHKRPLITPDEIRRYFGDPDNPMSLVLTRGQNPLSVRRVDYFQEIMFAEMFDPHPDHPMPPARAQLEACAAEARRQAERQKQYEQAQKQEHLRKRQEEIKRANERYFADRNQKRQEKQRQAYAQYREAQNAYDREFLPKIIGGVALLMLWGVAVIVF